MLTRQKCCTYTEPKSKYKSRLCRENDSGSVVVVEAFPVRFRGYTYGTFDVNLRDVHSDDDDFIKQRDIWHIREERQIVR